jgi:hypothetical protein
MHTSIHINGWVGPNPQGFTTRNIHWPFENDFVTSAIKSADVAPLVAASKPQPLTGDLFDSYVAYLRESHSHIETVYQLQKAGALTGKGTAESRAFTAQRLAAAAIELRNMIDTAWIRSAAPATAAYTK